LLRTKPDDGHEWPKHVFLLLLLIFKLYILYIILVVLLTTLPYI